MKPLIRRFSGDRSGKNLLLAAVACLALWAPAAVDAGQRTVLESRREQLLNGLKLIILNRPGDPEVLLKLRIHSGAAFDLAGKEGTMAFLGDALFPDPATRQYVTEELGGRLEVTTDYDAINITLKGPAQEYERLLELLRNALVSMRLTPEVLANLREARAKTVREMSLAPEMIADRAVAARLFGTYPYGRLIGGTPESLARIDRADILLARERFLNPNNATLVQIGGVEHRRAMRALRQLLGAWRKSDLVVPATFQQPEAPDSRTLIVDLPGVPGAEVRLALRGLARSDRDLAAAEVLALLVRDRWQASSPELKQGALLVRHDAHALGGVFRLTASVRSPAAAAQALEMARQALRSLAAAPPSQSELEGARRTSLATLERGTESPEALANTWLDIETYRLDSVDARELMARSISALTPADVQRVAARLFRDTPVATVAVGDAAQLRVALTPTGSVEILGASAPPEPKPPTTPVKRP